LGNIESKEKDVTSSAQIVDLKILVPKDQNETYDRTYIYRKYLEFFMK